MKKKNYLHVPAENKNVIFTGQFSNPSSKILYDTAWQNEPEAKLRYLTGRQCHSCAKYAALDRDWGICVQTRSRHFSETIFEHFTCVEFKKSNDE